MVNPETAQGLVARFEGILWAAVDIAVAVFSNGVGELCG